MTITVLAILFILVVLTVALLGYKVIIKQGSAPADVSREHCSLCRREFDKAQLVERQVGDYRIMYFCATCISGLQHDLTSKN